MANTVSSIKRVRTTEHRTAVNQMRTTKLRNRIRAMRRILETKDAAAAIAALPETYSAIDKAAKQGVIKKNTASRYKSRLTARVKAIPAAK
ncbi:MAG: 30S ribosomal protein S20 [Bryobacteraceae bacterium]|nr:30S ribosomal protein S20 [Bryobacteraceae bacterium]